MSNPGDWIDFPTLVARCRAHGIPRSPRTLRRYYKDAGVISYRQARRGARVEFNWTTVERELRLLDNASINAHLVAANTPPATGPAGVPDVFASLHQLTELVEKIARKVGVEREVRVLVTAEPERKSA